MDLIDEILDNVKTIAVVGLSDNPARASHGVSAYMQAQGYRIIPVNPALKGAAVLGEQSYDNLESALVAAQAQGVAIDLVGRIPAQRTGGRSRRRRGTHRSQLHLDAGRGGG